METGEFFTDFRITDSSIVASSPSSNTTILLLLRSQAIPNTAICIFCANSSSDIFRKKELIPTLTTLPPLLCP